MGSSVILTSLQQSMIYPDTKYEMRAMWGIHTAFEDEVRCETESVLALAACVLSTNNDVLDLVLALAALVLSTNNIFHILVLTISSLSYQSIHIHILRRQVLLSMVLLAYRWLKSLEEPLLFSLRDDGG